MNLLRPLVIGDVHLENNLVLAPMAGYSDIALRALCRQHGAGLVSTEMVAAPSAQHENRTAVRRMTTSSAERPVMVQVIGSDEAEVQAAARLVTPHADLVGFNLGCPAHQVLATGCGAELLKRPQHAARLVAAIKGATERPVVVKLRAGTNQVMDLESFGARLVDAGADALILHARTAAQGYSGKADWGLVARLKAAVDVPVIGNGDIRDGASAAHALHASGADGIAIGRGALGDPRIFHRIRTHLATGQAAAMPTPQERLADLRSYTQTARLHEFPLSRIRNQAISFARGFAGAREARVALNRARSIEDAIQVFAAAIATPPHAGAGRADGPVPA